MSTLTSSAPVSSTVSAHRGYILAVDLGTSGCKCAIVSFDGQVQSWAFTPVTLYMVESVGVEQDPEEWWQAFLASAQAAIAQSSVAKDRILAITCSCQGEVTVAVDRHGQLLHRALSWLDMRGASAVQKRVRTRINAFGYGLIKLYRWIHLCGGAPALSGKDSAGHIIFIQEHWPEIYQKTYKFLNALDYLNLRLSGRFVATHDSATTLWATDNRDLKNLHYSPQLIRQLGIDVEKLPELVRSTDIIGTLLPELANQLGLSLDTKIVAGAIDNSAAAVGSGAVKEGQTHLYLGTSSWLSAHVPFKRTHIGSHIASIPSAIPERYLMMAMQSSAGSNLSFLRDRILYPEDELYPNVTLPDIYPALDRMAARVPAGARGLLYTPWLFGERCPHDSPHLRAGLFNLSLQHCRADIVRAFLEGIALNTRWMMGAVSRFLGQTPQPLTVVGGGAKSKVWCQILADVLEIEIWQPSHPIAVNSIGAAYIGAVGLGELSFDDIPHSAQSHARYHPNPAHQAVYQEQYQFFVELYQRLSPLYRRLNNAAPSFARPPSGPSR